MYGDVATTVSWGKNWRGYILALVLLLWVDLATTLVATDFYGLGAEANPLMRWLLGNELAIVLIVHMLIFVAALVAFAGVVSIGRSLDGPQERWYRLGCFVWITALIVVGLGVSINNSLLTFIALLG